MTRCELLLIGLLAVAPAAAGGWSEARVSQVGGLPFDHVSALAWDGTSLWAGGFDGGLARLHGGRWTAVAAPGPPTASWINALCWHDDTLWVGSNAGLGWWRRGSVHIAPLEWIEGPVNGLRVAAGRLVVAGADAVWVLEDPPRDPPLADARTSEAGGAPAPHVEAEAVGVSVPGNRMEWRQLDLRGESLHAALLVEGKVWAGGLRGILRQEDERWRRYSELNGALPDSWVTALAPVGRELWVGTYDAGLLAIDRRGRVRTVRDGEWVNPNAIELLADGVAIGTQGDGLLVWDRPAGRWRRLTTADGLPSGNVTAVLAVGDRLWVGTRDGLARVER